MSQRSSAASLSLPVCVLAVACVAVAVLTEPALASRSGVADRLRTRLHGSWNDDTWPTPTQDEKPAIASSELADDEEAAKSKQDQTSSGKLMMLRDQCPSTNTESCSGHGNCVRQADSVFGVEIKGSKGTMMCHCNKGWFGTGCQLTLDEALTRKKKRDQLARLLSSPKSSALVKSGDMSDDLRTSVSVSAADFPKSSIFSRHFPVTDTQAAPTMRPGGDILDVGEPDQPSQDLRKWVYQPTESLNSAAAAASNYRDLQQKASYRAPPSAPDHTELFRNMVGERNLALYTNSAGDSIVAPPVYKGQQTIREDTPDPGAIHFIEALNEHFRKLQLARNGLA